jgi:hypothetical protein
MLRKNKLHHNDRYAMPTAPRTISRNPHLKQTNPTKMMQKHKTLHWASRVTTARQRATSFEPHFAKHTTTNQHRKPRSRSAKCSHVCFWRSMVPKVSLRIGVFFFIFSSNPRAMGPAGAFGVYLMREKPNTMRERCHAIDLRRAPRPRPGRENMECNRRTSLPDLTSGWCVMAMCLTR